jgi:hypothetical protein
MGPVPFRTTSRMGQPCFWWGAGKALAALPDKRVQPLPSRQKTCSGLETHQPAASPCAAEHHAQLDARQAVPSFFHAPAKHVSQVR